MKQLKLLLGIFICTLFLAFTNAKKNSLSDYSLASLFKIERSKDANQILYDVRVNNDGEFDAINPINVYWVKNTNGGKIEPLTWIQKKYAYGLKYINISENHATFRFVCYKKMYFTLRKSSNNKFEVFTKYNDRLVRMDRIYIQIDGGTFWFPNIRDIKIFGEDAKTGKEILAIIQP